MTRGGVQKILTVGTPGRTESAGEFLLGKLEEQKSSDDRQTERGGSWGGVGGGQEVTRVIESQRQDKKTRL